MRKAKQTTRALKIKDVLKWTFHQHRGKQLGETKHTPQDSDSWSISPQEATKAAANTQLLCTVGPQLHSNKKVCKKLNHK